ncbi:hypothetical protein ACFSKI_16000 [Pseudogracilibacillus auburnensis]|uniref:Flagellar protein FliT n=1 Tax=Pseudogracilibacillus auburnensis TaxID=1494959 RepID=A0A2V3W683_9BACI|nr:hypothetical protein [Pseudogracilibacillus auburnensis]MBO1001549.1 hypothetical protein [Pseudogracilibacillus auburnensis]PXW89530.1 flagellar protein FliT [Pseudogracilibacillus auburnensis]
MGRLQQLHDVTVNMLSTLQQLEEKKLDRESVIKKMDELIVSRDAIIQKIKAPYTEEEIEIGQQVVQLNEQVKLKMDHLYDDVKSDMKKVKQKKELNRSYINPYGQIKTTDGMYLDSKQ